LLDRDGVINQDSDATSNLLTNGNPYPAVLNPFRIVQKQALKVFCVTINLALPVLYSDNLHTMHDKMTHWSKQRAYISGIQYCPSNGPDE